MPPGSNYALKIVKWWIDPGLEGDAYADQPYLYGPALSSWNHVRICGLRGEKVETEKQDADEKAEVPSASETETSTQEQGSESRDGGNAAESTENDGAASETATESTQSLNCEVIEEGAEGSGVEQRDCLGIPATPDQRRKFYLNEANREAFTFEAGRLYKADFGNSYISFSGKVFSLPS